MPADALISSRKSTILAKRGSPRSGSVSYILRSTGEAARTAIIIKATSAPAGISRRGAFLRECHRAALLPAALWHIISPTFFFCTRGSSPRSRINSPQDRWALCNKLMLFLHLCLLGTSYKFHPSYLVFFFYSIALSSQQSNKRTLQVTLRIFSSSILTYHTDVLL